MWPPFDGDVRAAAIRRFDGQAGADPLGTLLHPYETVALISFEIAIDTAAVITDAELTPISANEALDSYDGRVGVVDRIANRLGHDRSEFTGFALTRWIDLVDIHDE